MNRYKKVKIASIFGIIGNIFLFVIKMIISLITGSKAMLADTFNSAGDIMSSTITFIGNKIASKPGDDDHNLGHGKAEYIFSMIISEIIIISFVLITLFPSFANKCKCRISFTSHLKHFKFSYLLGFMRILNI